MFFEEIRNMTDRWLKPKNSMLQGIVHHQHSTKEKLKMGLPRKDMWASLLSNGVKHLGTCVTHEVVENFIPVGIVPSRTERDRENGKKAVGTLQISWQETY